MDERVGVRASDRRAARPPHSSRPYPGNERRQLPAQSEQAALTPAIAPTPPTTIRHKPDAYETSPCSRTFSSASLMHSCSGKRCNFAPTLTHVPAQEATLIP